jgi:hypothetical protein
MQDFSGEALLFDPNALVSNLALPNIDRGPPVSKRPRFRQLYQPQILQHQRSRQPDEHLRCRLLQWTVCGGSLMTNGGDHI